MTSKLDSKTRTTKGQRFDGKDMTQKTLTDLVNPTKIRDISADPDLSVDFDSANADQNERRRKRQRTSKPKVNEGQMEPACAIRDQIHARSPPSQGMTNPYRENGPSSPRVIIPLSLPETALLPALELKQGEARVTPHTPPKKQLRLNANGKFSSPISKNTSKFDTEAEVQTAKGKRRNRKSVQSSSRKSLITTISYGKDESSRAGLSQRIDRIMNGEERVTVEDKTSWKKATPSKAKSTHPFFLAKPIIQLPEPLKKKESPRKASAVTPGKLRLQRPNFVLDEAEERTSSTVQGSALLRDRLMMKHPGAKEPPFPTREQAHVRNLPLNHPNREPMKVDMIDSPYGKRKHKEARLPLPAAESIFTNFCSGLVPEEGGRLRPDGFQEPHPSLRIPEKLVISGKEVLERSQIEVSVDLTQPDELGLSHLSSQRNVHPALESLSEAIPNATSAFDEDKGENFPWAQKYAPSNTAKVLQSDRAMCVLKKWLNSLTVQSVSGTHCQVTKPASKLKSKRGRTKKHDELDDFLVDSDEEIHDMNELDDHGDDDIIPAGNRKLLKSIVQVSSENAKLSNAVLLSGPHGCGKTAAAYAVAKELGFKVFEINPSDRRNGKDLQDRVGDMAENHLVKHHGNDTDEQTSSAELDHFEETLQRDLQSGRQGTMSSFFKPSSQTKPTTHKTTQPAKKMEAIEATAKKSTKEQQQSLILLEEVDVLFKEDKDFWTAALKLMISSKRPFILTCNDEDLVPLQTMSLHAILRLSPPSIDLATDYMLLIAAKEGHLLKREAVESLYQLKGYDLRASIMELDHWCQIGIGDPRGGLSWIFQRWPRGTDIDDKGRRLRVTSKGTYQTSMGLVPDAELSHDRALGWTWREFDVEPADALGWSDVTIPGDLNLGYENADATSERLALLQHAARLTDALSASDVFTASGLSRSANLDSAQPEMSEKARGQYIEGLHLLQTDEKFEYSNLSQELLISSTLSAYRANRLWSSTRTSAEGHLIRTIVANKAKTTDTQRLTRHDLACFDVISVFPDTSAFATSFLTQSVFDGPLQPIVQDIAPYVRSIVQFDRSLEEQRNLLDRLTTDGRRAKRARTTRAARSALHGSQRASTRREKWFAKELDVNAVLATGGSNWPKAIPSPLEGDSENGTDVPSSSAESLEHT